ncbi:hypothetical protein AQJ30_27405 [Streptomyces longwoodensis]|uniref:Uncharacterized protein n=1 Tax=Streptomyces longwoodensis TaxID=68231 RepID=A0A101QRR2_9ACTN|nr:hypothetical protein [Streptomyces longwoodensis]KUN34803.1 hypothetical protein AQJ30_27405 [Streptomyces longwoodensis]
MESQTSWFFFDERVPGEQVVVPVKNGHGLGWAICPTATPEQIVEALNATMRFVLGVGLLRLGDTEKPPDEEREE